MSAEYPPFYPSGSAPQLAKGQSEPQPTEPPAAAAASPAAPQPAPAFKSQPSSFASPTAGLFWYYLRSLAGIALLTAAISIVSGVLVNWLVFTFAENAEEVSRSLAVAMGSVAGILMLTMGIILPLHLEMDLNYGVTRRQHTLGLLGASAVLAAALSVVMLVVAFLEGAQPEPRLVACIFPVVIWLFFLTGWFIVLGYQLRRVVTAVLSTLCGAAVFFCYLLPVGFSLYATTIGPFGDTLIAWLRDETSRGFVFMNLAVLVVLCGVLLAALLVGTRRIVVKV